MHNGEAIDIDRFRYWIAQITCQECTRGAIKNLQKETRLAQERRKSVLNSVVNSCKRLTNVDTSESETKLALERENKLQEELDVITNRADAWSRDRSMSMVIGYNLDLYAQRSIHRQNCIQLLLHQREATLKNVREAVNTVELAAEKQLTLAVKRKKICEEELTMSSERMKNIQQEISLLAKRQR